MTLLLWRAHRDGGDGRSFADWARTAQRFLERFAFIFPVGRPRLWLMRAKHADVRGRRKRAIRAARRSLAVSREMVMPFDEAMACNELALLLPEGDPERTSMRDDARANLERLGVQLEVAQV